MPEESVILLLWSAMGTAGIVWKNWDAFSTETLSNVWETAKTCGSAGSVVVAVVSIPFSWEEGCPWLFQLP